mmetsp:Transcript_8428/g.15225  ORF Transcript_8428/g.15225 Transcript_8428/m.15225 type:complete len:246 (+) Transcript_8428:92-829(+)
MAATAETLLSAVVDDGRTTRFQRRGPRSASACHRQRSFSHHLRNLRAAARLRALALPDPDGSTFGAATAPAVPVDRNTTTAVTVKPIENDVVASELAALPRRRNGHISRDAIDASAPCNICVRVSSATEAGLTEEVSSSRNSSRRRLRWLPPCRRSRWKRETRSKTSPSTSDVAIAAAAAAASEVVGYPWASGFGACAGAGPCLRPDCEVSQSVSSGSKHSLVAGAGRPAVPCFTCVASGCSQSV